MNGGARKPPPIIEKRNVLFLLAAFVFVCGWMMGNRYVLALGEIYGVILGVAFWNSRGAFESVRAERLHYPRTFEGSEVSVLLRLWTRRARPIHLLEAQDVFPPASSERVRHLARSPFNRENQYEIHYAKTCARRRGPYEIGPVTLRCADPMGLFPQTASLPLFTQLLVYPQAHSLPQLSVLGEGTLFHVGQETTRRAGHSEEFIQLREYRPGDPPARIHWPSSARQGKFMVKEFQETVVTEVVLFLDLSRVSQTGLGDQTSTEWMIRAGASIAARALELSHLVEVYAIGARVDHVPLGGGRQHLLTILDRMTLYRPDGRGSFAAQMGELAGLVRKGATVVIVCGAATADVGNVEGDIRRLTLEGTRVIVVPVDERRFIKLIREQDILFAKAGPFEDIVARLRLTGADVFPLQFGEPLRQMDEGFGASEDKRM